MRIKHRLLAEGAQFAKPPNNLGVVNRARPGSVKFRLVWLFWLLVIPALHLYAAGNCWRWLR
ncbi:MAG: hypothetical protein A2X24_10565 [Chloroflexi bacterium GWB2_54_36]|nr:MAG: hypothetical protein A2X24_10565 [Chloroflexi bacterium GWB2_54_36]